MSSSPRASFRGVQRWLKPLTNIRKRLMRFYKQPSRQIDAAQTRLQEGLSTLPVELLELIFQLAASDNYETALNLCRVSSAVKKWTAPMLYHTVHLRTARHAQLFQRTTDHLIPSNPSFLAHNVRYIVFDYCIDDIQDVFYILRACTGIIGLANETAIEASPGFFIQGLADLTAPCTCLTRLVLHIPQILPRARLTLPRTLTHLSLNIDYGTLNVQSFWDPVRNKFPPLTHIMVGMELPLYSDDPVDALVTLLRLWALDLPSSFQVILVRLISPEGLAMAPSTMPDSAYLTASELRDLPKVAILYSTTPVFELYDPLTLDSQHLPTMVYNGDPSASWLKNEIWEVADSLLLSRRFMD